jgi:hypothetical protein
MCSLTRELVRAKVKQADSMVGNAADQREEQEKGEDHEQAAATAADHAAKAQTEAESKALFD